LLDWDRITGPQTAAINGETSCYLWSIKKAVDLSRDGYDVKIKVNAEAPLHGLNDKTPHAYLVIYTTNGKYILDGTIGQSHDPSLKGIDGVKYFKAGLDIGIGGLGVAYEVAQKNPRLAALYINGKIKEFTVPTTISIKSLYDLYLGMMVHAVGKREASAIIADTTLGRAYESSKVITGRGLMREKGQGLVEYALILTVIAVVTIALWPYIAPIIASPLTGIVVALAAILGISLIKAATNGIHYSINPRVILKLTIAAFILFVLYWVGMTVAPDFAKMIMDKFFGPLNDLGGATGFTGAAAMAGFIPLGIGLNKKRAMNSIALIFRKLGLIATVFSMLLAACGTKATPTALVDPVGQQSVVIAEGELPANLISRWAVTQAGKDRFKKFVSDVQLRLTVAEAMSYYNIPTPFGYFILIRELTTASNIEELTDQIQAWRETGTHGLAQISPETARSAILYDQDNGGVLTEFLTELGYPYDWNNATVAQIIQMLGNSDQANIRVMAA
ncbi:MAG: hypothetical protein Q7U96_02905, partial [Chloroflexota bacterium]|nr:hypothetical protein [Chloroflexota bacterium]